MHNNTDDLATISLRESIQTQKIIHDMISFPETGSPYIQTMDEWLPKELEGKGMGRDNQQFALLRVDVCLSKKCVLKPFLSILTDSVSLILPIPNLNLTT